VGDDTLLRVSDPTIIWQPPPGVKRGAHYTHRLRPLRGAFF
jgi:hypothetical protein